MEASSLICPKELPGLARGDGNNANQRLMGILWGIQTAFIAKKLLE